MTAHAHGVETRIEGSVAVWTLNRPQRRNALARATVRQLGILARAVAKDRAVRAVVLTGEGDQAFCAGADLHERQSMTHEDVRDLLSLYRSSFGAVDRCPKPIVAAINGVALGGGFELALACDFRVMATHANVGLPEVSLGIIPGAGGIPRLTRLVGEARAKELILFSERLDADAALASGVVHRVGDPAIDVALEMARSLAAGSPTAIAQALAAVDGCAGASLDAALSIERRCYERTLESPDREEALRAFREKRAPVFQPPTED